MPCPHGVNLKHKTCRRCEAEAETEAKAAKRPVQDGDGADPAPDRRLFDLDLSRLDEEWLQLPRAYFRHAMRLAEARAAHERAKARLDVVEAEIDREIRLEPKAFGLEKATEGAIDKAVTLDRRYRAAVRRVVEARHAVDVGQAVCDALEHKKKALENLVHLHGMAYFSTPRPPAGRRAEVDEIERRELFAVNQRKGKERRNP